MKRSDAATRWGLLGYFLKGSLALFLCGIAANFLGTLLGALIPQVISVTIDSVIGREELSSRNGWIVEVLGGREYLAGHMWLLAVLIASLALSIALFHYLRLYFNTRANQTMVRRMRDSLLSHIRRLPMSWHRAHRTGDVIQRCTSDVNTVSNFVSGQLVTLFRILILAAVSVVMMFLMNPTLAAVAASFVPVLIAVSYLFDRKMKRRFRECDEQEAVLSAIAQENFSGVRVVKAFGAERRERDKFERQNTYYTGLWVRIEKFLALYWTASDLFVSLQLMLIIVLGSVFCVRGELSPGDLVAFISYNTMLMDPVRQLGRIISNLSKAGVSIDRISEIMNAVEERQGGGELLTGDIVFDNVSFSYGDGKNALENISFTLPEGETLGIVGATGSGKSTLVALLAALYPPSSGTVTVGGQDISALPPSLVRSQIGLVLQEGHLFSRTVGENIALAAEDAGADEVREAAKIACVDENIHSFAKGYDTLVGERGVTLSGGQKQRVAIARTLLRHTPYLIFDDSLSAVDSDTDAAIRANLKEFCKGATTVSVSHRVTTVMHADNILVMDGGRIIERGTHEALLAAGGMYRKIYDVQMSLPEELAKEVRNG